MSFWGNAWWLVEKVTSGVSWVFSTSWWAAGLILTTVRDGATNLWNSEIAWTIVRGAIGTGIIYYYPYYITRLGVIARYMPTSRTVTLGGAYTVEYLYNNWAKYYYQKFFYSNAAPEYQISVINWAPSRPTPIGHVSVAFFEKGKLVRCLGYSARIDGEGWRKKLKDAVERYGSVTLTRAAFATGLKVDVLWGDGVIYDEAADLSDSNIVLHEQIFPVSKSKYDAAKTFAEGQFTNQKKLDLKYNLLGIGSGETCSSWAVKVLGKAGQWPGSWISRWAITIPIEMGVFAPHKFGELRKKPKKSKKK